MSIPSLDLTDPIFDQLRQTEFERLDAEKQVYLDFTGGNLYPKSLLDQNFDSLRKHTFGNPHSTNPSSLLSTKLVDSAREKVLEFFNAEDYFCVFTANASAALQIVGENYPFNEDSVFLLTSDNHNSVNGIREYCKRTGGHHQYVTINYEDLHVNEEDLWKQMELNNHHSTKLFAFPAQSNVSGAKHNLSYIKTFQDNGWDVLLDAAAFVPTSKLDLQVLKPNFVCVSFYKIFGYPTGIGCLLIRKDTFPKLQKRWFAGGTVSMVAVNYDTYFLVENHERFENGTINYLDIPAIENGLRFIESIGITRINARVKALTHYLITQLSPLTHSNGNPVLRIFGPEGTENRGGNIILNFFDEDEKAFSYEYVQEASNLKNISIRSGCFCNPGIDEINSCLSNDDLSQYFSSRDHIDMNERSVMLGKMRGAIRVSVGIATNQADLDHFISFAKSFINTKVSSS